MQVHIVGEGSPIEEYKRIVEKYEIAEHVIFYGLKTGRELDSIYDQCSIGVENLGFHRTGVYRASTLKAREYAAKGLPFITCLLYTSLNRLIGCFEQIDKSGIKYKFSIIGTDKEKQRYADKICYSTQMCIRDRCIIIHMLQWKRHWQMQFTIVHMISENR